MKERVNQLFKDKLILVMLVLGLLTIVAAAGIVSLRKGDTEESPYLNMEGSPEHLVDGEEKQTSAAGNSDAAKEEADESQENLALADTIGSEEEETIQETKAEKETYARSTEAKSSEEEAALAGAGRDAASALVLNFSQTQSMMWPVQGNVLLDYSMDSTIYFATLEQYKVNPGLVIQGDVSQQVISPANARVLEAGNNEEIGNYLILDLGDEYSLICGQLKEVQAVAGEYLEKGQVIGYVAEPTKYYTLEGPNVFVELQKEGKPIDPLDYFE